MSVGTLDGPRLAPSAAAGGIRQLVILLHGFGANGDDLIALAPYFQHALPGAAFVAPNAPEPCEMAPVGYQWFSLARYDPNQLRRDPKQAPEVWREMLAGVERVAPRVNGFIDAELARAGLDDGNLVLVGFSQGTMLALHVGLRRARAPAAILGFSGALVGADRLASEIRGRPPVFLIHGDADDVVPIPALFQAAAALGAAGVPTRFHVSAGTGHGIAPDGIELGGRFLGEIVTRGEVFPDPVSSRLAAT